MNDRNPHRFVAWFALALIAAAIWIIGALVTGVLP